MFSLFRYFAFVISLCRLRYFVMSPSLFRLFVFSLSSFRLLRFRLFGLFVMVPSLCRREITKRRNGTNQPPYISDTCIACARAITPPPLPYMTKTESNTGFSYNYKFPRTSLFYRFNNFFV